MNLVKFDSERYLTADPTDLYNGVVSVKTEDIVTLQSDSTIELLVKGSFREEDINTLYSHLQSMKVIFGGANSKTLPARFRAPWDREKLSFVRFTGNVYQVYLAC